MNIDTFAAMLRQNSTQSTSNRYKREKAKVFDKHYGSTEFLKFLAENPSIKAQLELKEHSILDYEAVFEQTLEGLIAPKTNTHNLHFEDLETGEPLLKTMGNVLQTHLPVKLFGEDTLGSPYVRFVNKNTGQLHPLDERDFAKVLAGDLKKAVYENIRSAAPVFEPFQDIPWGLKGELRYNLYQRPEWRKLTSEEAVDISDTLEFFELLFPNNESRSMALNWAYTSLTSRSREYLVLIGREGTGKGIFAEKLMFALHGLPNCAKSKRNFVVTDFNGFVENKTYVYVDELTYQGVEGLEVLKNMIEDVISIESKGKDQRLVKSHMSVCITGNFFNSFYMDPTTSRKFTYAEVSDRNLLKIKGVEWVDRLVDNFKDPAYLLSVFQYLEDNYSGKSYKILHGRPWEMHCRESAPQSIKMIVDKIVDGKDLEKPDLMYRDLKNSYEQYRKSANLKAGFPQPERLANFFDAFRWEGKKVAEFDLETNLLKTLPPFRPETDPDEV